MRGLPLQVFWRSIWIDIWAWAPDGNDAPCIPSNMVTWIMLQSAKDGFPSGGCSSRRSFFGAIHRVEGRLTRQIFDESYAVWVLFVPSFFPFSSQGQFNVSTRPAFRLPSPVGTIRAETQFGSQWLSRSHWIGKVKAGCLNRPRTRFLTSQFMWFTLPLQMTHPYPWGPQDCAICLDHRYQRGELDANHDPFAAKTKQATGAISFGFDSLRG